MADHKEVTVKAALVLLRDFDGVRFQPLVCVIYDALCPRFFKPRPAVMAMRVFQEIERLNGSPLWR